MIWCDGVERWLNDGMPPRGADAARTHARRCVACAKAIADAVALEAMLATAATTARPAPAGFTDAVMARIDAERDEARAPGAAVAPPAWWLVFASEPAAAVALAVVPVAVAIGLFLPSVREFLVASVRLAITSSLGTAVDGATAASADTSALFNAMSPVARSSLAIGLGSLLFWCAFAAPTWWAAARSPRRGSPPRSRS